MPSSGSASASAGRRDGRAGRDGRATWRPRGRRRPHGHPRHPVVRGGEGEAPRVPRAMLATPENHTMKIQPATSGNRAMRYTMLLTRLATGKATNAARRPQLGDQNGHRGDAGNDVQALAEPVEPGGGGLDGNQDSGCCCTWEYRPVTKRWRTGSRRRPRWRPAALRMGGAVDALLRGSSRSVVNRGTGAGSFSSCGAEAGRTSVPTRTVRCRRTGGLPAGRERRLASAATTAHANDSLRSPSRSNQAVSRRHPVPGGCTRPPTSPPAAMSGRHRVRRRVGSPPMPTCRREQGGPPPPSTGEWTEQVTLQHGGAHACGRG